jgi:hypothetical protein
MVPPRAVHTRAIASDTQGHDPASASRIGLLVREGESGIQNQRLTRSIHKLRVVKGGVGAVDFGFQGASHGTGKNSGYSEVLAQIHCSYSGVVHSAWTGPRFSVCIIPP